MRILFLLAVLSCSALAQSVAGQGHAINVKLYQAWEAHEKVYARIYGHHRAEILVTKDQAKKEEMKALQDYETALIPLVDEAKTFREQILPTVTRTEEDDKWDVIFASGRRISLIADSGLGVYIEKLSKR